MYKCAHCKSKHRSAREGRACAEAHQTPRFNNTRAPESPIYQKQPAAMRPNEWSLKTPEAMVRNIRPGRYCVELGANMAKFIRVTLRDRGKMKGYTIIQSQHSESFKTLISFSPTGSFWIYDNRYDMELMMVAADPWGCATRYGQKLNKCCACGKKLTDDRSRWYGIGPECETRWPEIINLVHQNKGEFVKV